ncbi:MAG TPA: hypothetical protein VG944_13600 [Fimbriimonas sp.]|nr:hypothetical protein [Fimbriimonas sp.]
MSETHNPFEEYLPEVVADPITVDEAGTGLVDEPRSNLWTFGISNETVATVSEEDILRFVHSVEDARERQIVERFGTRHSMVFYCWFDEQSSYLCFSMISASNGRLPFGAPVQVVEDLRQIVQSFLEDPYHDGIPMSEFKVITQEDLDNRVEPPPHVVRVWTSVLPRSVV